MIFEQEPIIKVGIQINSNIEFELNGLYKLNDISIAKGNYFASVSNNKIHTNFSQGKKIVLEPETSSSTFVLKKVAIGKGFHWEQKEDQEFEGGLTLQIEDGKIRVINSILLESYLKSVISSEMSAMNDLNLLKAHAIVSRSWLLAQIQNRDTKKRCHFDDVRGEIPSLNKQIPNRSASLGMTHTNEIIKWYDREDHETFDVCADDHCQRYQGINKVISLNAEKAISETRGTLLLYKNEICDARFSKCCGGISEDFDKVWQPVIHPYLTAITDNVANTFKAPSDIKSYISSSPKAFCNNYDPEILKQILVDFDQTTTNFFRWEVKLNQNEISHLIKKKSGFDFGQIIDLIPIERGKSGRLVKLKIEGTKQSVIVGKELEIRKWLSESHLFSSAFIVEKRFENDEKIPSNFILNGAGWGHGVGLCQIGAAVMSKKGYLAKDILKHYFNDTKIVRRYK